MNTNQVLKGIHHITLVTGNAQRNAHFYVDTLGFRFVKKTVNFDRPETYHLYYGDEIGTPGTLVTFFEWPHAASGKIGAGTTHHFAMIVDSSDVLLQWKRYLTDRGVPVTGPYDRPAFRSIYFTDPDGVILEIATLGPGWKGTENGEEVYIPSLQVLAPGRNEESIRMETWPNPVTHITPDMEIRGIHHITAVSSDIDRTDSFYQEVLGYQLIRKSVNFDDPSVPHWYWGLDGGRPGTMITYFGPHALNAGPRPSSGQIGRGITHHIAFEVQDSDALEAWRQRLQEQTIEVTPILDRQYSQSIYFRDPDGLILEIATTVPGFLVDQSVDRLGKDLALPPWLESRRAQIEAHLAPIVVLNSMAGY